jgi:ATP-dependent RNA helicase DHX36
MIGTTVGYNIRFETEVSRNTQVLFVTPGVLLRKMQSDPLLTEFSHIIIDEAHERDRFTEFLFIVLKDLCLKRASLKLILMSATLNTNKLSSFFGGLPQINMGGSVFPVQEYFLEDVLRFTDYTIPDVGGGADGMLIGSRAYYCSVCGKGPFKIAEELGSHAAFCTLPTGQPLKIFRESKSIRKIETLVKVIFAANVNNANKNQTVMSPVSVGMTTSCVEDVEVDEALVEDKEEDDDDANVDEDEAAKHVIAVEALDASSQRNEDFTGGDPMMRQYQTDFDDNLVDYDLIVSLLGYIYQGNSELSKEGSVLIFLPGWDDISKLNRALKCTNEFSNASKYKIIQLHSAVPKKDQAEAFLPVGKGQFKIILSTNVAETSITIDDVSVVIDSGKVKELTYDPHIKLSYLKTTYVSKSSARQRKGRAGRTRYTEQRF